MQKMRPLQKQRAKDGAGGGGEEDGTDEGCPCTQPGPTWPPTWPPAQSPSYHLHQSPHLSNEVLIHGAHYYQQCQLAKVHPTQH